MTRILAAVLLCAASSVGCSSLNTMTAKNHGGKKPDYLASSQSAPRPEIQRAGYESHMGVMDMPGGGCGCMGEGCGPLCGADCNNMVNGAVDCVLDCDGCCGCGDACGGGGGYNPGYGGVGNSFGDCSCGGAGRCACCQKLRGWWQNNCSCGGAGKCPCCCKMRAMCAHARNCVCDPGACVTDAAYNFNPGPSAAQVAYPYYTTRGPRDFFLDNPPSIGPY